MSVFHLVTVISGVLWAVAFLYCVPGFLRLISGRSMSGAPGTFYDALKSLVVLGSANRMGFTILGWIARPTVPLNDPDEQLARLVLYAFSAVVAAATLYVVRSYSKTLD